MTALVEIKPYQRVVAATGLSNLADGIRLVALPLLVLEQTSSPLVLAAVVAASLTPWLVFGLWAGALADRADRRLLAQRTALVRVVVLVALGVLIAVGLVPIPLLLVTAFVLGLSEVLADNVNGTLIPSLVSESELEAANSRMVGAEILGNELIGPPVGAALFATAASLPFFTNAGLLAVAFLLLAGLPLLRPIEDLDIDDKREAPRARDGLDAIRSSPVLRTITWSSALLAAVDGAWFTLLLVLITEELEMASASLGLFLAVGAIGGLAGTAIANRVAGLELATVATASLVLMAAPLAVLGVDPTATITGIALVLTSGAFSVWNVIMVSARQRATAHSMLGRVGATYRLTVMAAALAGTLLGGVVAELFSIRFTLTAAAVLLCAAVPVMRNGFATTSERR